MSNLPKRINAMRVITYDVDDILSDTNGLEINNVGDLLEFLEDWMYEDFGGDLTGIILQDENGNEL